MPKPKTAVAGSSLGPYPLMSHDYAAPASEEMMETQSVSVRRPLESTPTKIPVPQKKVEGDGQPEVSNVAILDAINNLTAMMELFGTQLKQNSVMIAELSKSVEFNAKEIKNCKSASSNLGKEVSKMAKENAELKERVQELECYKRRWNLKLRGLKEKTEERTRDEVLGIMAKINPQWSTKLENMVDSVHRVGKLETGRNRQVVIQFTMRYYRDEFWRRILQYAKI
ncbi:cytoplasmic dynein 2 heavy chain 1-like protein [Labeo rohita]|uniref:Cytoplasmic dynein 2 heavy chain 1-like protein n=1 Tax=Labeo rohita TaxID=84645 RepID=A0A498MBQ4_LABRO|nr:cytoplasmic dynein 2 heavy chain 1-like protein [Labeo rohita]RXN18353.1 cytoplasmic dynein 2 heavy chain 1-like protein [Labeo rohita]